MSDRRYTNPATGEVIEDPTPRPFGQYLIDRPQTAEELAEGLWDLVVRCQETRKRGSLTFTITIEPLKGADHGVMSVSDKIRLKLPEFDRPMGVFYTDREGNLSRQNPNQPALDGLTIVTNVPRSARLQPSV